MMDFWEIMRSTFSRPFSHTNLDNEPGILQIGEAMKEESDLWKKSSGFMEPEVAAEFREKWLDVYEAAKKRTVKRSILNVFSGRSNDKQTAQFVAAYEQLPDKLRAYNDRMAGIEAEVARKFLLPVEGKSLDQQQLKCIVKSVRNHLILAGAGTGKTTTIVGYVKYLLKTGVCVPSDILVLSFTNASASEMSQRLSKELEISISALTFHKLGLEIIKKVQGRTPKIFSADMRPFVRQQLEILINDMAYLRKLSLYLIFNVNEQKSEFDFKTEEEYQMYLKYNPPKTLKKEVVKSYGELDIANFLTQNGIHYVYEKEYPVDTRTEEYGQYYPDFYLPDFNIYIEYFGINRQGEVPSYFAGKNGKSATQVYREGIMWKRELHHRQGTKLIETYAYEKIEGKLLPNLEDQLKKAGVVFEPLSSSEMWEQIAGTQNQKLDRVAELFGTVITLIKSNNCTLDDIRTRNHKYQNLSSANVVLDLVEPIYVHYQEQLRANHAIDFNDMINLAAEYVRERKYLHAYRYVVIDEYQDISQARYHLLNAMRQQKDFRLFCVGDDWQSIYRFSGSDIGFILNFEKYWGASEISRIETTYRFTKSLIDISSGFIMKNPEQKRKQLRSAIADQGFSMEKITGYRETDAVNSLIERLKDLPQGSSILFLGRYRFDIKVLDGNKKFSYWYDATLGRTKVRLTDRPDLSIEYMTIHGSKGLQAEYVFLLNNKAFGMGFPSQISDAPILQLLLDNCDHYPFAEERRLFYVGITRARKKVWLVTLKRNESLFVKEIVEDYGQAMRKEQYTCPQCGGRLVRRTGPYGEFYGCSNYRNGCKYKRKITVGNS